MHTEVTEKQMPWSPLGQENSPEDDAAYFQQLCTKLFHFLQQRNSTFESHAKALSLFTPYFPLCCNLMINLTFTLKA